MTKIQHRSSKRERIDMINNDQVSETDFFKNIYTQLAGENPELDLSLPLTKYDFFSAIKAFNLKSGKDILFETNELKAPDITAEEDFTIKTGENKTLVLEHPVWRDEYVGGDWGNAIGNEAPTFAPFTIGGIALRKLVLGANDSRSNCFEIPHDMILSESADLQPEIHAHIRPTTNDTGTVILFISPEWSKANQSSVTPVDPLALAEMTATLTITVGSALYPHYVLSFGNLPVNSYNIGDLIGFKVSRKTGEGTYTENVIIEKIALHVPCDTGGSRQIYIK